MQLTKQEVHDTQLLVCTPEKYDVATRKGGDGSLGTLVSLIIIDEVHLLADERGAVIETIVARTQRYVESSQRLVRIIGLSATLPNYQDVASFLRVNSSTGLYYFGAEYRPIPLDQSFIGVTEKQRLKRNDFMNRCAYLKMIEALKIGKQVMIFVHSRRDTSKTLEAILELCAKYATYELLENAFHEKYTLMKRAVDNSKSTELQELFRKGVGTHHAGMLRNDRLLSEQLFEMGLIKVLCCTATLAWGVNLPAHTVIIKGTEIYDPERGGFVDLSILDVLQIFGRAGRPQYDSTGHAILITPQETLNVYLSKLAHQAPIESCLIKALADHMNAEIVNGTVSNVKEASIWLSYTFLFIRMKRNPLVYGISFEETFSDPQLTNKRMELVKTAAKLLDDCMMVRYDQRSGNLAVTDLGRIASHYYIKYNTIENFNHMLTPYIQELEAIHVLCSATEFDQLKVRPEEMTEIDKLNKSSFLRVKTSGDDVAGKVNILLQGYLNNARITSFTLQSDTNYIAQNSSRICRALYEICLKRGWATLARYYLILSISINRRMLPNASPLRQFNELPYDIITKLEKSLINYQKMLDMTSDEIGELVRDKKFGPKIKNLLRFLPVLNVETLVKPITKGILQITVNLNIAFDWNDYYHGKTSESFILWIEDTDNDYIYHAETILFTKKQRFDMKTLDIIIPVKEPLPLQYYVRIFSETWLGCESCSAVTFKHLLMPHITGRVYTDLLDLHPIPVTALNNQLFESIYRNFKYFNPIQTQMFHVLYHTKKNVLVGAPTGKFSKFALFLTISKVECFFSSVFVTNFIGSGKTITAELAILAQLRDNPEAKTIYIAPLKALARERLHDWQKKLTINLGLNILELTGDFTPSVHQLKQANIIIVTPEKWDSISRQWQRRDYVKHVELVIIDEIHLLGVDRGPVLEVIVSRMRFISAQTGRNVRFIGLSTALANPHDLADWLGIDQTIGLYNFRPSVRPVPMTIHIQGFPGKAYCPRMATMNKPIYGSILEHSPNKPVLIFVSSRRQTRLTALDLISYCAAEDNPKQFLHMPEQDIADLITTIKDRALRDTLLFGVAIHHAGLDQHDRSVAEDLFLNNKIQVLVCTSTLACKTHSLNPTQSCTI